MRLMLLKAAARRAFHSETSSEILWDRTELFHFPRCLVGQDLITTHYKSIRMTINSGFSLTGGHR